jgi:hypothetical protein
VPLIRQKMIYRADLRANRHVLYVFGDNAARTGYGGQAAEMRGEPNATGIRTKWKPTMFKDALFKDIQKPIIIPMWEEDFDPIRKKMAEGGIVVMPMDGVGSGFAQLAQNAPELASWLDRELKKIFHGDEK